MRLAMMGKWVAVLGTMALLGLVLARIGFLVDERRGYQWKAEQSVQQSHAGAQTLVGPLLQRVCVEEWMVTIGEGKTARQEATRREFTLFATPSQLTIDGDSQTDLRYRGLFKVNGYAARLTITAQWADIQALRAGREHAGSTLACQRPTLLLATTDVRGLRNASLQVNGQASAVRPGTGHPRYTRGLHAELDAAMVGSAESPTRVPIDAQLKLDLIGTTQLAVVPAAESMRWTLRSDWPHPSFGGRFLPQQREIGAQGFSASWAIGSLATPAANDVMQGVGLCPTEPGMNKPCLDTLAVDFVDPVSPYTLSDRAIKYGLLFVTMTFAAVGLAETLARDRIRTVHPVQYGLVGLALCLFFLLLLSLSEHLAFGTAYALAACAVVLLLGAYARHMLGHLRDGVLFGAGIALLYALLYLLLLREQTALVIGSIGLFSALAVVMMLTRRVDWYRLAQRSAATEPRATTGAGPAAA